MLGYLAILSSLCNYDFNVKKKKKKKETKSCFTFPFEINQWERMKSGEGRKNSKKNYIPSLPFFSIIITERNLTSPRLDGPSRDRFTFHRQRNRCKRGTFKPSQTGGAERSIRRSIWFLSGMRPGSVNTIYARVHEN